MITECGSWRFSRFWMASLLVMLGVFFFIRQQLFIQSCCISKPPDIQSTTPKSIPLLTRHPLAPPYPHPYVFTINHPEKCSNRNPFLVLLVFSENKAVDTRIAIRDTWGNESNYLSVDVVTVFLTGISTVASSAVQKLLEDENAIYGDIIQQDFLDTYYNLTLKTLMGMEWVVKFCPTVSYVMKIDKDTFLNVEYLIHQLLRPDLSIRTNYFTGLIINNARPVRDKASKWYVPEEIYPNNTFPPYCAGPGYVFSGDMAKKIYDIAQVITVVPVEDSFMGICLHHLNIPITCPPNNIFIVHRINYDRCLFHKLIIVHHYGKAELQEVWVDFWGKKALEC